LLLALCLIILKVMNEREKIDVIKKWLGSGSIDIFGRPFAGKDAQGKRLAQLFGSTLIGGGEILRHSTIPNRVKEEISEGKLAPTDDYINIVLPFLSQPDLTNQSLFLSSVGRWHGEEEAVMAALDKSGHPLKAVIYLNISPNESHTRWLAREINNDRPNRYDDNEETLNIRFTEFQDKTIPVMDYYRDLGLLVEIDGKGPRGEITDLIIDALYKLANN
jgi:adenylate kinase